VGGGGARRRSRVPAGRVERLARIGWMAGELALGGVAEGVRRLAGGDAEAASPLLTGANGRRLARRLSSMRGAAMKLGQLISLEGEDLLPPEVSQALAMLRSDGDAMPASQLHRVLGRNYGRGWEARFAHFDPEPIAAASIGQVHQALSRDGRRLALKIQYPGVSRSIGSDVDNLAAALRLARLLPVQLDLGEILAEAKRQLRREADYRAEAESLRRYGALLAGDERFAVPSVHDDFTTMHVLAMDRMQGRPLEDLRGAEHPQERRDAAAAALISLVMRELFEFRFVQTDPNFANYLWLPETGRIGLLDLGAARDVPEALSRSYARLCRAGMRGDREGLYAVAVEMGLLEGDETPARRDAFVDFLLLASEPFRADGAYDFGRSDVPARAREAATALALRHGFLRPPPPEVLFLQRKLGGSFLLCARLGARVDLRALLERAISPSGPAAAS
jgi:predicted unusual protein kinase regulating ubiquinone biosynthesis (AarF/ABC1/UbiB family)